MKHVSQAIITFKSTAKSTSQCAVTAHTQTTLRCVAVLFALQSMVAWATPLLTYRVTPAAQEHCESIPNLSEINTSVIVDTLEILFPTADQKIRQLNVSLVIDKLSSDSSPARGHIDPAHYRAFFNPADKTIVMDCTALNRRFWTPTLAHELVHALLQELEVPSWVEEGIAQEIETQLGGPHPANSVRSLLQGREMPASVYAFHRPLLNSQEYAMSYLAIRYTLEHFGGMPALRSWLERYQQMKEAQTTPHHTNVQDLWFEAGRRTLSDQTSDHQSYGRRLTLLEPTTFARYFLMTLALSHPSSNLYHLTGWSGLSTHTLPQSPRAWNELINPMPQNSVLSFAIENSNIPATLPASPHHEFYYIEWNATHFWIQTVSPSQTLATRREATERRLVVMRMD